MEQAREGVEQGLAALSDNRVYFEVARTIHLNEYLRENVLV